MTDPTPVARPKLTSDIDQFIRELRDGDILLFDSLHAVSHIIKLVDNSPVNHCALYRRAGRKMVHAALPLEDGTAVREESLRGRLCKREDRTVTAFRLSEKDIGADVLHEAERWLGDTTRYGFKDLPGLAAQCINRSYGKTRDPRERTLLYRASRAMSSISRAAVRGIRPSLSVTCSEFVYSCYIAADAESIRIRDPLSLWNLGRGVAVYIADPTRRDLTPWTPSVYPKASHTEPDPEIEFVVRGDSATPSPPSRLSFDAILARERSALQREMLVNYKRGKTIPVARQGPAPYAQTITPFDLWQSSSLTPVHVLHLPPEEGDPVHGRTGQPPPTTAPKRTASRGRQRDQDQPQQTSGL